MSENQQGEEFADFLAHISGSRPHAFVINLVKDGYHVLAFGRDPGGRAALSGARATAGLADLAAARSW